MKVSVIVPVYNSEKYLSNCIESVLNQTYSNLELILINDGSKDNSGIICDKYSSIDSRVKVIHQINKGVSSARNEGLKIAEGELVIFADSDDYLDSDMLELLIRFLLDNNADVAHCGYKHIVGEEIRLVHDTKKVYIQESEEAIKCLLGGHLFAGGLWNKIYRKELLKNIQFDSNLKINEDILFNFEVFRKAKKTVFADYAKYNYVAHTGSSACFTTPSAKKLDDACKVNKYIYEQLTNTNISNIGCERYVRSLIDYYRFVSKNDKTQAKIISKEIWTLLKNGVVKDKKVVASSKLIHYCPCMYKLVYSVYNRIRKPNWEV